VSTPVSPDSPETVVAAAGAPLVARLRRTFQVRPWRDVSPTVRRRGRLLLGAELAIVELPRIIPEGWRNGASADFTGEIAFALGVLHRCRSLLLVIPGASPLLADRIVPGLRREGAPPREILPDILVRPETDGTAIPLGTVADPAVHAAADWASRRLSPHRFWVLTIPDGKADPTVGESGTHRLLRSVVAALEEQAE
jgi:hypothetical protein